MASIYDKALKRKDFSGVTNKDKPEEVASNNSKGKLFRDIQLVLFTLWQVKPRPKRRGDEDKAAKADDPKAGADVGKIVNLMAGDANRV
jgi:hypothetical protein